MRKLKWCGVNVVKGLVFAGLLVVGACGAEEGCQTGANVCTGEYTLKVFWINSDVENVHMYRSGASPSDENRIPPGGIASRNSTYRGSFFDTSEWDLLAFDALCEHAKEDAVAGPPQTWEFVASRSGQTLGTATVDVTYADVFEIRDRDVDVRWNGATLTAQLRP